MNSRRGVLKRSLLLMVAGWLFVVGTIFVVSNNVFADEGGWIGDDEIPGTPSGGNGGTGVTNGYSWIFYKSLVSDSVAKSLPTWFYFTPNPGVNGGANELVEVKISRQCAEHKDQGGGFWHVGINAISQGSSPIHLSGGGVNAGETLAARKWCVSSGSCTPRYKVGGHYFNYTTGAVGSTYGHGSTFTLGQLKSWSAWVGGEKKFRGWSVSNSDLDHVLYYDDKAVFSASKFGREKDDTYGADNNVLKAYKKAYKAAKGKDYTGSSLPNNLYAFCYWEGLNDVNLDAFRVTESGTYLKTDGTVGSSLSDGRLSSDFPKKVSNGSSGGSLTAPSITGYDFKGWRKTKDSGSYLSTSATYNVGTMTADATYYAVYAKKVQLDAYRVNSSGTYLKPGGTTGTQAQGQLDGMPRKGISKGDSSQTISAPNVTGYDFKGWRKTKDSGNVSGAQTNYSVGTMNSDVVLYAVYNPIPKYKITLKAYDADDKKVITCNSAYPVSGSEVYRGERASVSKTDAASACGEEYEFVGFATSTSNASSGTYVGTSSSSAEYHSGTTYYIKSITADAERYVVYKKVPKYRVKLIAWDIDSNAQITCNDLYPTYGSYVLRGKTATAKRKEISGSAACKDKYNYVGFAKTSAEAVSKTWVSTSSSSDEYISGGDTYNLKNIQADQTRYVGYEKKSLTVTLKACDTDGNQLSGVMNDVIVTVKYGATASMTRRLNDSQGYTAATFKGFADSTAKSCAEAKNKSKITTTDTSNAVYVSGSSSPKETINVKSLTANGGYLFAMYELPDLRLTEYAVDALGNSLDSVIPPVADVKRYGFAAEVCRPESVPAGLEYKFWASTKTNAMNGVEMTSGVTSDKKCYKVDSLTESKDVFVVYDVLFEGKSNAASIAGSTNMAWKKENASVRLVLNNCSPTEGCTAHFVHSLRQTSGHGTTDWNVYRTSNYVNGDFGANDGKNTVAKVKSGNFTSTVANPSQDVYTSEDYKFKPGVVICETLEFGGKIPTNTTSAPRIRTTACASATGSAQPDNVALIDVKVKNVSIEVYNSYRDETVYAKPGDVVYFKSYYKPKLQYTYNLVPQRMQIDGGSVYDSNNKTLGALFNEKKASTIESWNNAYNVICDSCSTSFYSYDLGDFANKTSDAEKHTIAPADVGKELKETVKTNDTTGTRTTPSQVTFSESSNKNVANVITAPVEDVASVIVPYNFMTSTTIQEDDGEVAYAGEVKNIKFVVKVEEKENSLTDGTYATPVPGAKTRIEVSSDGGATWISSNEETISGQNLNPNGGAGEVGTFTKAVNVPDLPAGSQFCARSVVWPQNSGSDSNIDPAGFGGTAESPIVCFVIAKKPSFQVWGGEVLINGNTTVPVSQKNNLEGYDNYTVANTTANSNYVFGSWTELGLIGNKTIKGVASGATLGYSAPNLVANPGGLSGSITDTNNCKRNVLSFANKQCSTSVGNVSASGIFDTALLGNLHNMVRKLVPEMIEPNVSGEINLSSDYAEDSTGKYYSYATSDLVISESSISRGVTHIVYTNTEGASANVTIKGNIVYESGPYSDLRSIPKLFIYGKNINIACSVNRIDAVLITEGTINTCYDSDNINSEANSNQLRLNGVIMAKSLKLMRTYGAGTGNNSIVPAEVINYDSSMYLWALRDFETMSEATLSENEVVEVFKRELAPRY